MAETLYEGPAHAATFVVPFAGILRFRFNDLLASGYVRSPSGALSRVASGMLVSLPRGQHVLTLYDPKLATRVSIVLEQR